MLAGLVADRCLDGLADGDAEAAGRVGDLFEDGAAGGGLSGRAGDALGAPDLHHHLAERLLVEADPHHEHLALDADELQAKARALPHCPAPVSVVRCLMPNCLLYQACGHGGVGLVAAGRADTLSSL